VTAGYAQVNGLNMYYEVHGTGRPLVVLPGGLLTIDLSFGAFLPGLARDRQVIAVELQGHGRTADIDREFTLEHLADDIAGLLDHLGIDRADLFGFSLGGLVAFQLALRHSARVDHLVLAAVHFRADGYHDEIRESRPGSTRMPTEDDFREMREAYIKIAPDPGHFEEFAAKASAAVGSFEGWPDDALRSITQPTLLVFGDTDFVRLDHAVEMQGLIPGSQLAVLPATTHMAVMQRADLLLPIVESFLP
jgi:pimeloyl-ACP methyl ester carboxylesterase